MPRPTHLNDNAVTSTGYTLISGTRVPSTSVGLEIGGSDANLLVYSDGMVSGQTGIVLLGSGAQLTNYGTVVGTSKLGVSLADGGTITNDAGLIEGARWGVVLDAGDTLMNLYAGAVAGLSAKAGSGAAGTGGGAVYLSEGTLVNYGEIFGGGGGTALSGSVDGGAGGVGVEINSNGSIQNSGKIAGGYGGSSYQDGGAGGNGINDRILDLSINGFVVGGTGGYAARGNAGDGGVGVSLLPGETLTNVGTVSGGTGGNATFGTAGSGGVGFSLLPGETLNNNGTIMGGYGGNAGSTSARPGAGGAGVYLPAGEQFVNNSDIHGGGGGKGYTGGASDGASGAGVYLNGGTLVNNGEITGFLYQNYVTQYNRVNPLPPGIGVDIASGQLNNNSVIQDGVLLQAGIANNYQKIVGARANYFGSQPLRNGGAGLVQTGGTFNNFGYVDGGLGIAQFDFNEPGGVGVYLYGGIFNNEGVIEAGLGLSYYRPYAAFRSGNGANIFGGTLVNTGIISGMESKYFTGGPAVFLDGGTLINDGEIHGGAAYAEGRPYYYDPAVKFGNQASTLIVEPGSYFSRNSIVGNGIDDTLILAPSESSSVGTLTGLGSSITGITNTSEGLGADWTLTGANILGTATSLSISGALNVAGSLADMGNMTITGQGTLLAEGGGNLQMAGLTLAGGTLMASPDALIDVGNSASYAAPGTVLIQSGATLTGYGVISDPIEDNGTIVAEVGALDLVQSVYGSGTIEIDQGATVSAAGALTGVQIMFAAGGDVLSIADLPDATGRLDNFGSADSIDLLGQPITSLKFADDTLTIKNGKAIVGTLTFQGNYKSADFSHKSDGNGGTDIIFSTPTQTDPHPISGDLPFSNLLLHLSKDVTRIEQPGAGSLQAEPRTAYRLTCHTVEGNLLTKTFMYHDSSNTNAD